MIHKEAVMAGFLRACPSFQPTWREHVQWWKGEEAGLYNDFSEFARHLTALKEAGKTDELPAIFTYLEEIITRGDDYVQEAAVVGLIEDLTNGSLWKQHSDPDVILPDLGPEATKWWPEVKAFWHGERRNIGDGIDGASAPYWRRSRPTPPAPPTRSTPG